ncbi:hypothetical protein Tsp_06108 [Trichinella spiralis]|uniref:hypothetical protein n=1 Tax=Trichinella spiralis TaxID=6334 RepID=UPI0001EFB646|nr:hypothetical protein Tsp_06108 [Trichinella spiralis]
MRSKCAITKISTHFAHYRNGLHHQHRARSYSCVSLSWLKPLFSIVPEICVASLITGSICTGFRIHHTSLVVRVAITAYAPGFALRLCPRANKNLHMPLGYSPGNL